MGLESDDPVLKGFVMASLWSVFVYDEHEKLAGILMYLLVSIVLESGASGSSTCQARGGQFGCCKATCPASVQHLHAGGEAS